MPTLDGPTPFGNYLLLDLISSGGMAEVFRAVSFGVEGFQRIVAIKRILPHWVADPTFVNMFIDEARIAVQINDPNVVQILELGMVGEQYYIAMEYVAGLDLRHLLGDLSKQQKRLPIPHAAFIISSICSALDHAHRKCGADGVPLGIVHRDVTPHNVLLGFGGSVKVTDFGIAKAENRASKTESGTLKGKFCYMSPEQARGLDLDRRADVFTIGILLYELLTGTRLFSGDSDFHVLERVRDADVPPLRNVNSDVPESLARIVQKALAADREQRYQWASELYDDLLPYLIEERSVFTSQKLKAFLEDLCPDRIAAEQTRIGELLRLAKVHGPIVERPEPAAPAPMATAISNRFSQPRTVILAVGSGEVPKVPDTRPPAVDAAPSAPREPDTWNDTLLRTDREPSVAARAEPSENCTRTVPAKTAAPREVPTEPMPVVPETTRVAAPGRNPIAALLIATVAAVVIVGVVVLRDLQSRPGAAPVTDPPMSASPGPTLPLVSAPTPGPASQSGTTVVGTTARPEPPPPTNPDEKIAKPEPVEPVRPRLTSEQVKSSLARTRRALEATVKNNGILAGDLPALDAQRARTAALMKRNKLVEALDAAEKALALARGVEIDQEFINNKLARFNKLSDANKEDKLKSTLEKLAADTATAIGAGDFRAANQHLNKAFRLLRVSN